MKGIVVVHGDFVEAVRAAAVDQTPLLQAVLVTRQLDRRQATAYLKEVDYLIRRQGEHEKRHGVYRGGPAGGCLVRQECLKVRSRLFWLRARIVNLSHVEEVPELEEVPQ
jgi:hypothetical protein